MNTPRTGALILIALLLQGFLYAADLKNRSTSASGQFIIYCDDKDLRGRVVIFAEEVKERVLRILKERDDWDMPVLITLDPAIPGKTEPGVNLALIHNPGGGKVEINVRIGDDPALIHLQKHIIRALLLEIAYRDRPPDPRTPIVDAPWWITEGLIQTIRRRDGQLTTDVFKSIADRSKLPPLDKFITQPPLQLNNISNEVDRACALCLLEALLALPNGPENLTRYIRDWPAYHRDPVGGLTHHFPVLAESEKSLSKWWTLQLARFADSERWQGLTLEQTDRELTTLLDLQIAVDKTGRTERYPIADFEKYLPKPGAKQTLRATQTALIALSARANPLFRPIITDYEQITALLIAGKTKDLPARITAAETYRKKLTQRMALITDYLNWYEATQPTGRNGVFDEYLRSTKAAQPKPPAPPDPRITEYLDTLEKEFEPLIPPGTQPPGGAAMR